jgi:hypothetical protein
MYNPYATPLVYNMVDLGLPSGTLWADRNVGAKNPEDGGLCFQWGSTIGWTVEQIENGIAPKGRENYWDYDNATQKLIKYPDGGMTLQLEDDAARVNMGDSWRIPSQTEFRELVANTNIYWILEDGTEVLYEGGTNYDAIATKFVANNGKFIIIPYDPVGRYYNTYWLNTSIKYYSDPFNAAAFQGNSDYFTAREVYIPVRGVCSK